MSPPTCQTYYNFFLQKIRFYGYHRQPLGISKTMFRMTGNQNHVWRNLLHSLPKLSSCHQSPMRNRVYFCTEIEFSSPIFYEKLSSILMRNRVYFCTSLNIREKERCGKDGRIIENYSTGFLKERLRDLIHK